MIDKDRKDGREVSQYEEPRPPKLVHVHSEEVIDQGHLDLSKICCSRDG